MLRFPDFKENYKMILIDLCKHHALDAEPKAIQQINFTINLDRAGNTIILLEEAKKIVLEFSQGTVNIW